MKPLRNAFTALGLLTTIAAGGATPAAAGMVTFDLNFTFSSGIPGLQPAADPFPDPYVRAIFDDGGGTGSVTLTLQALNLTGSEFMSDFYFNIDESLLAGVATQNSGITATIHGLTVEMGKDKDKFPVYDQWKADGDGLYDFRLEFPTSGGTFLDGSVAVFTITGTGLTAASFDFMSSPAGGSGPFSAAAHIQSISLPTGGTSSVWIAPDDGPGDHEIVPEPSSVILLAMGGVSLLGYGWRRRKADVAA